MKTIKITEKEKAVLKMMLNLADGWLTENPELVPNCLKSVKEFEEVADNLLIKLNNNWIRVEI